MQGKTELLRGDRESITIIYRNLTGQNQVSPNYLTMMQEKLGMPIDPIKLSLDRPRSLVKRTSNRSILRPLILSFTYSRRAQSSVFVMAAPARVGVGAG